MRRNASDWIFNRKEIDKCLTRLIQSRVVNAQTNDIRNRKVYITELIPGSK